MLVVFSAIPENGLTCDVSDDWWVRDLGMECCAPLKGHLRLVRQGSNTVVVSGQVESCVRLLCDRCLTSFEFPLSLAVHLLLEVPEAEGHWRLTVLAEAGRELEVVPLEKPEADVGEILQQQLCLSMPEKKLCRPECRGLCPGCGADLNLEQCGCAQKRDHAPFQKLAFLKKNNK